MHDNRMFMLLITIAAFFALLAFSGACFFVTYQIQENNRAVAAVNARVIYQAELPVCRTLERLNHIPPTAEFYKGVNGYGWYAAQTLRDLYRSTNCAEILHIKG